MQGGEELKCIGVDAGLVNRLGSDEGCEVLIRLECGAFSTRRGIWSFVSDSNSAVAGLDSDSVERTLALDSYLRKSEGH